MSWKHNRSSKGFTLIELLVVIAIIALLLSIIMPSLGKAKDVAKNIICRTNIKSMQLATILYTDAYEGKMPEWTLNGLWINKLGALLGDVDEARYCPRSKKRKGADVVTEIGWSPLINYGSAYKTWVAYFNGMQPERGGDGPEEGSYGFNAWLYTSGDFYEIPPGDKKSYRNLGNVRSTSNTPVFADSMWVDAKPDDDDEVPADFDLTGGIGAIPPNNMCRYITRRHEDEGNVGFVDGSQRPVKLSALWSLKWHREFKTTTEMTRRDGSPIYRKGDR